ncbi:TetR/AcrR family transcriptional regulator [Nocardioides sp. NPDC051685]|uniref:TetR/AcrR family transcriptional regulator n=1 Tax=Nocardioides sp. NPDC051685 TaxID=3364334 RepID=UPI00379AEA3D
MALDRHVMNSTPRRRRTARQQDLLDRLVALLEAEGFSQFTLDDLAGRLRCSKTTLYALAGSKQELVVEVVKEYFRNSVPHVEARVEAAAPGEQVAAYLLAVADYLRPLSRDFIDDLLDFGPTHEIYRQNTVAAAGRVRALITEGIDAGAFRSVNPVFVADVVAATMDHIQRGETFARTGMEDAEAYAELASFVALALRG